MAKNFNLLFFLAKIACPLTIISFSLAAIFGHFQPWTMAEPILNSYVGQNPIMVGFSYRKENKTEIVSRSYILIPSVLTDAKVIKVQQVSREAPVISESKSAFYILILSIFIGIFGTWWFWLKGK
jgi:hypothetical protein